LFINSHTLSLVGLLFQDIGALDSVKETLKELVMLPLQRPELFRKGNLTKPTKVSFVFSSLQLF
jgi:SpoVK/Ycf46/Vps4 family AAA+-type ATPase